MTVKNFEALEQKGLDNMATWYAIEKDSEDSDWGTGSCSCDEAVAMLREMAADHPHAQIAVISDSDDPTCEEIITLDDID